MGFEWPVGDTHTKLPIQLFSDTNAPLSLLDATVTFRVRPKEVVSAMRELTGKAYIVDPVNGRFVWQFSSEDVATKRNYILVIHVDYPVGEWNSYEIDLAILGG
jgi:hypothetical protein